MVYNLEDIFEFFKSKNHWVLFVLLIKIFIFFRGKIIGGILFFF
jgi:hypothetical protein